MQVSSFFIDEAACLAQLGNFTKLPPELRLLIWEEVFRHIPSMPREDTQPSPHILSIILCSRYLYHEISDHLYKDLKPTIQPWPLWDENKWMVIWLSSKKLFVSRHLKSIQVARQFIDKFPFDKMYQPRLVVNIPSSCDRDAAQIVQTWQKINTIVDLLKVLPTIPFVHVALSGKWIRKGKPRESVKDSTGSRADHDIAILPFTRLATWDFHLPTPLNEAISTGPQLPSPSVLSQLRTKGFLSTGDSCYINKSNGIIDIEKWLTETDIFLDSKLDRLRGPTASVFRLGRFKEWYGETNCWKQAFRDRVVQLPPYRVELKRELQATS